MVNNQEFSERLKLVLEYYHLSATAFAEKIGVQRSSISHLLSGRNKPSLDFVLKILKTFPDIELYWLMNGDGHFPAKTENAQNENVPNLFSEEKPEVHINKENKSSQQKEIERIVICYKDGTFSSYTP